MPISINMNPLVAAQKSKEATKVIDKVGQSPSIIKGQTWGDLAGKASAAGGTLSMIPHPYAKVAGFALSVPDMAFDVAALVNRPSADNAISAGLDFPESVVSTIAALTPNKIDDAVAGGLYVASTMDDLGYGVTRWLGKKQKSYLGEGGDAIVQHIRNAGNMGGIR